MNAPAFERPRTLIAAVLVAAVVVGGLVEALRWGTDLSDLLLGGRRFVAGQPLYLGSSASDGFIGPPFQASFMAPFALIDRASPVGAHVAWFVLVAAGLLIGVGSWAAALGKSAASGLVILAVLAIAFPLYREIQEQNLTCVFLGLFGLAALALVRNRDAQAGAWLGIATALKLFPGLALVYLLLRGRVRAAVAGGAVALSLTLLPVVRYGLAGYIDLWREWFHTRTTGAWVVEWINQSLVTRIAQAAGPVSAAAALIAVVALVAGALALAWRRRRMSALTVPDELALTLGVSVIASPIAWFTYWVLVFPLFLLAAREAVAGRRSALAVFSTGAILISVVGTLRRVNPGYEFLAAGLLMVIAVAVWLWPVPAGAEENAS